MKSNTWCACGLILSATLASADGPITIYVETSGSNASTEPTNPATPVAGIGEAVSRSGPNDLIRVGPGTYDEAGIQIDHSLGFIGAGPGETIIRAAPTPGTASQGIFLLGNSGTVGFDGMSICNGVADPLGPGAGCGGGIYNSGCDLVLSNVELTDNRSAEGADGGGGLYHGGGHLTVSNSWVSDNMAGAGGDGGGILLAGGSGILTTVNIDQNHAGDEIVGPPADPAGRGGGIFIGSAAGTFTISDSTISANHAGDGINSAGGVGGGIASSGTLLINRTTIIGNHAGDGGLGLGDASGGNGGGIFNGGGMTIANTTIADNMAGTGGPNSGAGGSGGAFDSTTLNSTLGVIHSTVTNNRTGTGFWFDGYGGAGHANIPSPNIIIESNIFFGNTVPPNGGGPDLAGQGIVSQGHNIIGDDGGFGIINTGLGDITGTDPNLGPLADYGGPNLTRLPLLGSPAIDAAPIEPAVGVDQRGFSRGPTTAIGSVDPNASPSLPGDPPLVKIFLPESEGGPDLIRLKMPLTLRTMRYQAFFGDDPGQLAIPPLAPGRIAVSSIHDGTGGPLLMDIPYLGELFRSDGTRKKKAFLIVFITARVVGPP